MLPDYEFAVVFAQISAPLDHENVAQCMDWGFWSSLLPGLVGGEEASALVPLHQDIPGTRTQRFNVDASARAGRTHYKPSEKKDRKIKGQVLLELVQLHKTYNNIAAILVYVTENSSYL